MFVWACEKDMELIHIEIVANLIINEKDNWIVFLSPSKSTSSLMIWCWQTILTSDDERVDIVFWNEWLIEKSSRRELINSFLVLFSSHLIKLIFSDCDKQINTVWNMNT